MLVSGHVRAGLAVSEINITNTDAELMGEFKGVRLLNTKFCMLFGFYFFFFLNFQNITIVSSVTTIIQKKMKIKTIK